MPASLITPLSISVATVRSYSSADAKSGGGPTVGQRDTTTVRYDAYPVSPPWKNGELALIASSTGSQARIRRVIRTARSRSSTPTCTWQAHTCCSSTRWRYSAAIHSYRRAGKTLLPPPAGGGNVAPPPVGHPQPPPAPARSRPPGPQAPRRAAEAPGGPAEGSDLVAWH